MSMHEGYLLEATASYERSIIVIVYWQSKNVWSWTNFWCWYPTPSFSRYPHNTSLELRQKVKSWWSDLIVILPSLLSTHHRRFGFHSQSRRRSDHRINSQLSPFKVIGPPHWISPTHLATRNENVVFRRWWYGFLLRRWSFLFVILLSV